MQRRAATRNSRMSRRRERSISATRPRCTPCRSVWIRSKMRMPIWTSAPTCRSRATTPPVDSSPSRCRLQPLSRQKERSRRSRTPQPVRLARTRGRLMRLPRKRQARQKRPSRRSRSHPRLSKRREQARRLFNLKLQLVHSRQPLPRMGLE